MTKNEKWSISSPWLSWNLHLKENATVFHSIHMLVWKISNPARSLWWIRVSRFILEELEQTLRFAGLLLWTMPVWMTSLLALKVSLRPTESESWGILYIHLHSIMYNCILQFTLLHLVHILININVENSLCCSIFLWKTWYFFQDF